MVISNFIFRSNWSITNSIPAFKFVPSARYLTDKEKARGDKHGGVNGPQVEIEATKENGAESGYVYGEACGGWMTPKDDLISHTHSKNGKWNQYRIIAKGPRIQTWVNGTQVFNLADKEKHKSHPKGFIGLQVHSIKKGSGPYEVAWKDIKIKEFNWFQGELPWNKIAFYSFHSLFSAHSLEKRITLFPCTTERI